MTESRECPTCGCDMQPVSIVAKCLVCGCEMHAPASCSEVVLDALNVAMAFARNPQAFDADELYKSFRKARDLAKIGVDGEGVEVGRGAQQTKSSTSSESPSACSEVVERLAEIVLNEATHFPGGGRTLHPFTVRSNIAAKLRTQAPAILDSWRERRVQEALRRLRLIADKFPDTDTIEDLKADKGYGYRRYKIEMLDGDIIDLRTFLEGTQID